MGGISPTSPFRVDSTVSSRQCYDVIPVAGIGSETPSPLQSVSHDSASISDDHSQDANVVGPAETSALDKFPAVMGDLDADENPTPEVAVQRPRRQAAIKQRQLLQRLLDEDAL